MAAFTFSTYAQYKASRDNTSTAGTIGKILSDASPSASCVSYVTANGKTYIDAINVIVDVKNPEIGDMLVYSSSYGFQWVKTGVASYGVPYHDISKMNANGYTCVGYLGYRKGRECLIISLSDLGAATWSGENTDVVPNCNTWTYFRRADGVPMSICSVSKDAAEFYTSSYYAYTYPLSRTYWAQCKEAFDTGASAPSGSNGMSCSFGTSSSSARTCAITYLAMAQGSWSTISQTINPADYDWSWDRWYKHCVAPKLDAVDGAISDWQGRRNTKAIVDKYGSVNYAARLAWTYSVGVTGFTANNWWLPSMGEFTAIAQNYRHAYNKGASFGRYNYWTSTQSSGSYAWFVNVATGYSRALYRYLSSDVRGVSAFQIPN